MYEVGSFQYMQAFFEAQNTRTNFCNCSMRASINFTLICLCKFEFINYVYQFFYIIFGLFDPSVSEKCVLKLTTAFTGLPK